MGIFDSNFNRNVKFDFDGKNLPFVSLADYAAANGTDAVVPVKGMFTHNKSKYGEKGLRDPFIIRSPEGDKFYIIATDLKKISASFQTV